MRARSSKAMQLPMSNEHPLELHKVLITRFFSIWEGANLKGQMLEVNGYHRFPLL